MSFRSIMNCISEVFPQITIIDIRHHHPRRSTSHRQSTKYLGLALKKIKTICHFIWCCCCWCYILIWSNELLDYPVKFFMSRRLTNFEANKKIIWFFSKIRNSFISIIIHFPPKSVVTCRLWFRIVTASRLNKRHDLVLMLLLLSSRLLVL